MKKRMLKVGFGLVGAAALGGWLFPAAVHADTPPAPPVSVPFATVPWGVPAVTNGNTCSCLKPSWLTQADRSGGDWGAAGGWSVAADGTRHGRRAASGGGPPHAGRDDGPGSGIHRDCRGRRRAAR